MPDLIDRSKITNSDIIHYLGRGYASCAPDIRELLDDQPTMDAVPVVRCKECIHRDDGSCPMDANYPWNDTKSDDYCSYGERRCENETD